MNQLAIEVVDLSVKRVEFMEGGGDGIFTEMCTDVVEEVPGFDAPCFESRWVGEAQRMLRDELASVLLKGGEVDVVARSVFEEECGSLHDGLV